MSYRFSVQKCDLRFQEIGQPDVVTIQERQKLAAGMTDRNISRGPGARVRLFEIDDVVHVGPDSGFELARIG